MTDPKGFERFAQACRAVRARLGGAALAIGTAVVALSILGLSLVPAPWREERGTVVPLVLALVVVALLVVAAAVARRLAGALDAERLAGEADAAAGLGEGDVRGALELRAGGGSSPALAEAHLRRVSDRLAAAASGGLLPRTSSIWGRRLRGAVSIALLAAVALGLSGLMRPGPTLSAALALSAPWRTAFPSPLPPLRLSVDSGVARGEIANLSITATGRSRVDLVVRPAGETPERRSVAIDGAGLATERVGPISSPTRVWVEDPRSASDTLLIRPLEPLLVQDVEVRVEYPAYLGREAETHRGQIPPLVTPEGTRLVISGETNLPLTRGTLEWSAADDPGPDGEVPVAPGPLALDLDEQRFGATLVPRRSGAWSWRLEAADAVGDPILPDPLQILLVPDLAPAIHLLFPAPDTTLGPDRVMPLVVDVEDDIGLRSAALRSWRSSLGAERAERREVLAPSPEGSRRAVFRHLLDRSAEELLPGDTIFYRFEAFDGHPTRGPALSDVFLLRVPTFTEVRDARADETRDLSDAAASLEEAMERLAEAATDAARRVESGEESGQSGFESTEEARSVLENAESALDQLVQIEEDLTELGEDVEDSSVADEALAEQLEMLAERYRELMESGLAEEIEALAEALQDLDPEAVREALQQLSEDSEWLREQLEQTLGMLDQAALDQEMKSAQANAEDLADAQRDLAESEEVTAEEFASEQERLAQQAEELAGALDELERRLEESGQQAAADSAAAAGERTDQAMNAMQEAGEAGQQGDQAPSEQSREAASEAAEAMEQAADALGAAQQNMEQAGRENAAESLGRARAEALSLAEEEGRLAEATRGEETGDPEDWRAGQNAVRQGLENMLDRLSESGNEAAMLDQRTGAMAGDAIARMDEMLERLAEDGARRLPSRAEVEGIQESLNQLAVQLLASEQAARAAQQQTQGQEAAEQMASLAQQQQAITQETSSLLMPGPKPSGRERTEEVTSQQQQIADRLRDLEDPEGELLGRPEELAVEAEELARQLADSGPSQETLERQRRLFQRMLDAGRSLEDEDLDPNRRESTTASDIAAEMPEIDPEALRGRRFPLPSEALLRDLPIFYRPLVFDYFDRLNRPAGSGSGSPASGATPEDPPPDSGSSEGGRG
ncbi:MAG: hypothetical protein R3195_05170 [Gemmatimonadota bacterium]|nr:hypothetical protein [Gemmatimonadota bacterium]